MGHIVFGLSRIRVVFIVTRYELEYPRKLTGILEIEYKQVKK